MSTARGMIGQNNEQLAISVPAMAVWADPKEIYNSRNSLSIFAVGMLYLMCWEQKPIPCSVSCETHKNVLFTWHDKCALKSPTTSKIWKLSGVYLRLNRVDYPTGETTTHLIGVTNIDQS